MNSRASLAGAYCCNWYPTCLTKTGISVQSFRSADKYIAHMLTHMDPEDVFEIADICRDSAPERPVVQRHLKAPSKNAAAPRLTKKALETLATQYEEEEEEEEEEVVVVRPKKVVKKMVTKQPVVEYEEEEEEEEVVIVPAKKVIKKIIKKEPVVEYEGDDEMDEDEVQVVTKKFAKKNL